VCFVLQVVPSAPVAGDTDYSDPFDARVDHRSEPDLRPVPCENGYMEPYEAQRVLTGQCIYQYCNISVTRIVIVEARCFSSILFLLPFCIMVVSASYLVNVLETHPIIKQ